MTRRAALALIVGATAALADSSADVLDVVAAMSSALSEDNVPGFMKRLESKLPGRAELESGLHAMVAQADVSCAIEPITDEGDDARRTLLLDWTLEMKRKGDALQVERRRESVKLAAVRSGKKWIVTGIEPASFFAPPKFK